MLKARRAAQNTDSSVGTVRPCPGSKSLFPAPFERATHDYADHAEWNQARHRAYSRWFFTLESGG
jgi:hypothetical protein